MMPSHSNPPLDPIRAYLRGKPVLQADLFGMSTRSEWKADTAVELLVTPVPGTSKLEMFQMEGELEALLGRKVHILLRPSLEAMKHGPARDLILSRVVPIYSKTKTAPAAER